jgi:hypothetical protein
MLSVLKAKRGVGVEYPHGMEIESISPNPVDRSCRQCDASSQSDSLLSFYVYFNLESRLWLYSVCGKLVLSSLSDCFIITYMFQHFPCINFVLLSFLPFRIYKLHAMFAGI